MSGKLNLEKFQPFPKNPSISKIFREIGLADELGSGMRNIHKYTKFYSGGVPSFEEGDVFKTTIPLSSNAISKIGPVDTDVAQDVAQYVAQDVAQEKKDLEKLILDLIRKDNKVSRATMAEKAGVSKKTIERKIKEMNNIRFVGSGYSGYWEILDKF